MKFKLDENLPRELAGMLRSAGHDAATVTEELLAGKTDDRILDAAKEENRILVTLDVRIADERRRKGRDAGGVILVRLSREGRQAIIGAVARALPLLSAVPPESRIVVISETKIRFRP